MRDEKLHAVMARSTFRIRFEDNMYTPHVRNTWKLQCRKSARHCGAKHISKSKCTKHLSVEALLEVDMSKHILKSKCAKHTILGALLEVEMSKKYGKVQAQKCKKLTGTEHLWTFRCRFAWQARAKREGFVAFPKTMSGVGHLKRIRKDACRVGGAIQETCSSEMLGERAEIS